MNDTTIGTTAGEVVSARRRGYILTAGVLLAMVAGGTLPEPGLPISPETGSFSDRLGSADPLGGQTWLDAVHHALVKLLTVGESC